MSNRTRVHWLGLALAVYALSAINLGAQNIYASVTGTISDPSGKVIVGAKVTAVNTGTSLTRSVTTGANGEYVLTLLPPGTYQLDVAAPGFDQEIQNGIVLEVDQHARRDFTLHIGGVQQTVEVQATAPLVQSETSSVGQTIGNREIVQLPLNGRNFLNLTLTAGGVSPTTQSDPEAGNPAQQMAISAAGSRSTMTSYLIDGMPNTDDATDFIVVRPSIDALQEFRVETNTYSAEFGRYGGGQVNMTTKSGTNQVHGSLYEFLRNDVMDAKNFFERPTDPKAAYRRNQFGGTFGGPIVKSHLFFFFSYEGLRLGQALTNRVTVPTDQMLACVKSGAATCDFSQLSYQLVNPVTHTPYPNNQIPASQISSIGRELALEYPSPNLPGLTSNFLVSPIQTQTNNDFNGRVDYAISTNDSIFARYTYSRTLLNVPYPVNIQTTTTPLLPISAVSDPDQAHNAVIAETHIFSPSTVNELKLGLNRAALGVKWANSTDYASQLGIPGLDPLAYQIGGWPSFSISGFADIGTTTTQAAPEQRYDTTFSLVDSFSWVKGSHSLKFGIDFEQFELYQSLPGFALGVFNFTGQYTNPTGAPGFGLPDLLLGYPASTSKRSYYAGSWTYTVNPSKDFYVLDDWKVTPNLTVNLGLRYEHNSPVFNKGGEQAGFNPGTQNIQFAKITNPALSPSTILPELPVKLPVPVVQTNRQSLCDTDDLNFAPRAGLAYRPTKDSSTVIRAGYGIFYNLPTTNNACTQVMGNEFPWFFAQTFIGALGPHATPNISLSNPFPTSLLSTSISIPAYLTHTITPYLQQYNVAIERQLGRSTVVEASYVGSRGVHLPLSLNINQAIQGTGPVSTWLPEALRRPYSSLGFENSIPLVTNIGVSDYNALVTRVEQRMTRNLTFLVTYTWSHSIDDGSATALGGVTDPGIQDAYNLALNRGSSSFDIRNRFTASYVYGLPFGRGRAIGNSWNAITDVFLGGWQLTGIVTAQSGFPLTATLSGDNSLTGGNADRPNLVGNPINPNPGPQQWFNTSAFVVPALGSFGNEGRGVVDGPKYVDFDGALQKNFRVFKEGHNLEFRGELYNALNHPNFQNPVLIANSPSFGQITAAHTPREIQLALRYSF